MNHEKFVTCFNPKDYTALWKKELVSKAAHIIAISENTKQDLIDILCVDPEKIEVIYHGVNVRDSIYNNKNFLGNIFYMLEGVEGIKISSGFLLHFVYWLRKYTLGLCWKAFQKKRTTVIFCVWI